MRDDGLHEVGKLRARPCQVRIMHPGRPMCEKLEQVDSGFAGIIRASPSLAELIASRRNLASGEKGPPIEFHHTIFIALVASPRLDHRICTVGMLIEGNRVRATWVGRSLPLSDVARGVGWGKVVLEPCA